MFYLNQTDCTSLSFYLHNAKNEGIFMFFFSPFTNKHAVHFNFRLVVAFYYKHYEVIANTPNLDKFYA